MDPDIKLKKTVTDSELERQTTRGRTISYAPNVQLEQRPVRTGTQLSRSRSRDSMSIRPRRMSVDPALALMRSAA